jgi:TetR/AcrR family transcriptional repressor of nem operon
MSPMDEGFRQRLNHIYDLWCKGIADAFSRGQVNGKVRKDVNPLNTATFIVASLAGSRSMAKNSRSLAVLVACNESLMNYFETLQP